MNHNGYWNNGLRYVHLLFDGFSDLIAICDKRGFIDSVWKQGQYIYENDQLPGGNNVGNYLDLSKPIESHLNFSFHKKENHDSKDEVKINHKQSSGLLIIIIIAIIILNNLKDLMDDGSAAQIFYISKFSK